MVIRSLSDPDDPQDCGQDVFLCHNCVKCLQLRLEQAEKERDDFKAKLDAELPAAWREDVESLDRLNEQHYARALSAEKERDEARTDIAEFKRMAVDACEYARILDTSSLPELDQGPLADAIDGVIACLRTILDGPSNPHPWAFNRVLRERDEARAERAFIETEYAAANESDLTRDALCLQVASLRALIREAHRELSTIEAITVSPSDTDGLIQLCKRLAPAGKLGAKTESTT